MNQPLSFAEQIAKQILTRHSALIDKKFLEGLTNEEADELILINRYLDAAEEAYRAPIMGILASIHSLETYLRECVTGAGDDADIVCLGEQIGYLSSGQKAISSVINDDDFWEGYQTWRENAD